MVCFTNTKKGKQIIRKGGKGISKVNRYCIVVLSIFVMVIAGAAVGETATINVPADHATIQAAINAAITGDEIIVSAADGPYVENITFDGTKTITVKTNDGAVIDGNASGSVVFFTGGDASTLDGFTITNGSGNDLFSNGDLFGGGILCNGSSPSITNCTISGNNAVSHGCGIGCFAASSPIITNCTISCDHLFRHQGRLGSSG